ncbi:MAG: GNAT family N-acetyltransferase [Pyrinomonadaceae bacterium]
MRVSKEISLREFQPRDAHDIFTVAMANFDHLARFVDWISPEYSLASAEEFIARSITGWEERESLALGIFREECFIGATGFVNFDWGAKKTEIGYWISRHEEGKGIVTAACRCLIDFAFNDLEFNRIEIRCSALNHRSSAIPKRLGFVEEGLLRQAVLRSGTFHDYKIYGLLASEWSK